MAGDYRNKESTVALAGGRAFFVPCKTDASVRFVLAGFTKGARHD